MLQFIKAQTSMLQSDQIMHMGFQKIGMYVLACMAIEGYANGQNIGAQGIMTALHKSGGSQKILEILKDRRLFNIDSFGNITVIHGPDRFLAESVTDAHARTHAGAHASASAYIEKDAAEEKRKEKKLIQKALGFE